MSYENLLYTGVFYGQKEIICFIYNMYGKLAYLYFAIPAKHLL